MNGRVVSLRHEPLGDAVYVGRAVPRRGLAGSPFGNPFVVGKDGTRAEVVEKYRSWILCRPDLLDRLHELRGRRLACWCSPEACHADVVAELVVAEEVLSDTLAAGVSVEIHHDRLRLSPADRVSDELQARLRASKPAVLSLLAARRSTLDAKALWTAAIQKVAATADIPHHVLQAALAADVAWINGGGPDGDT